VRKRELTAEDAEDAEEGRRKNAPLLFLRVLCGEFPLPQPIRVTPGARWGQLILSPSSSAPDRAG
jgi:hypothetical protein